MAFDKDLMYRELGVLGCTFENLTVTYVKTEMVDKAEQGDVTALYNLEKVARYSEVEAVALYARQQFERLIGKTAEDESGSEDEDTDSEDGNE